MWCLIGYLGDQIDMILWSIAAIAASILQMANSSTGASSINWKDVALVTSSFTTVAVSLFAIYASMRNTRLQVLSSDANANAQRWKDANQKESEQLENLLRTFHMPYLVQAEVDNNIAQDLRDRFNDPGYRMLIKLFDRTWLNNLAEGDRALVDEVCRIGSELRGLIEKNGGGADAKLCEYLARAATHFRILALAHEGKLGADPKPFQRYVYPRQLDAVIKADRDRIFRRLAKLRASPSQDNGTIEPLELSQEVELDPWPNPLRPSSSGAMGDASVK
jgi:hypothetical protein